MRYVKILLVTVASLLVFTGCEDFLTDARPSSDAGPGQGKWQDVQDLEFLAVGSYWMTSGEVFGDNQQVFGSWARTMPTDVGVPFSDAGGGYYLGTSDAEVFYGRNPNNPDNGALNDIWGSAYAPIHNANEGITFIENNFLNSDGPPPFEDPNDQIPRLYGEFKFLRAYNYWILAKTFAPPFSQDNLSKKAIPIRTEPTSGFSEASKGRGTVEELYSLIESDLKAAIENLPSEPRPQDPDRYNYSRAVRPAAKALLARVSFEMQKWGQAQEMATQVINDSRFNLDQDPIVAWNQNTFNRPNEVIWYYQWVDGDGVGHRGSDWKWPKGWNVWNATRANWGNSGSITNNVKFVAASYSFLEDVGWINNVNDKAETEMAEKDLRYQQLFRRFEAGDDTGGLTFDRPTVWVNKYYRSEENPPTTNVPLLRLPEMYLTRAIISFRGGNGANQDVAQARSDVNVVRERAGLDPIASGNLTEQMIHRERMREMAFEGDRLPYLQALRMDVPNGRDSQFDFVMKTGRQPGGSIPWNSSDLVYPIPTSETDFNTEL